MAMEAKAELMGEMERQLRDRLTTADAACVMSALADVMASYTLEKREDSDEGGDDLLDAYLDALAVQGRSEKTIKRYRYILGRMREAVHTQTRRITVYHLRQYLAKEKARGVSDRTLEGTREVFSAYFNWLRREGLIDQNPSANLGAIKYRKTQKDIFSQADIERMKFACDNIRDRAIITFLQTTGCRIGEMVRLNREDVNLATLECRVLGKGNKERTVYLDQVAAMTLEAYLKQRADTFPALFIGKGTERLEANAVRKVLTKLGEAAHVEHVHPHKFRRTAATNLIRHGMPIQEVAAILGHDKLDTTMQYVVLDREDIKYSFKKYA